MLLSQAILLGSMLSKQGFGLYGKGDEGRCALEAVADVTGAADLTAFDDELYDRVKRIWPWVNELVEQPHTRRMMGVVKCIWTLNDAWTRPRIAAWVATIEPPEPLQLEYKPAVVQECEPCTV